MKMVSRTLGKRSVKCYNTDGKRGHPTMGSQSRKDEHHVVPFTCRTERSGTQKQRGGCQVLRVAVRGCWVLVFANQKGSRDGAVPMCIRLTLLNRAFFWGIVKMEILILQNLIFPKKQTSSNAGIDCPSLLIVSRIKELKVLRAREN